METIDFQVKWQDKYLPLQLNSEQIILLEEMQQILIETPPLEALMPPFPAALSQDQLLQKVQLLRELQQAGYLSTNNSTIENSTYGHPDFSQSPLEIPNTPLAAKVIILSQFEDKSLLSDWCKDLRFDYPLVILIVDDYLDPRLKKINAELLHKKQPWLLVKLTGKRFFVGPYFSSQKELDPCWQCLNFRMRFNQPVREWLRKKNGNILSAFPIHFEPQRIKEQLPVLQGAAQALLTTCETRYFWVFEDESNKVKHPVKLRPQCPACGDPNLYAQQCSRPVVLQPSIKRFTEDGGVRTVSPRETMNALFVDISPVSGAIHPAISLSETDHQANQIFRSSFFRQPPPSDRLDTDTFLQITLGKGITAEQSKISALAEALERLAGKYQGDEPYVYGLPGELDKRALLPNQLMPFSQQQYQEFEHAYSIKKPPIHAALPYPKNTPLHWTPVWSLSRKESCYAPLTFCYADSHLDEKRYAPFFHSGGAAGNTLEEAILQGIFEVIERDAAAIWWYNKICRPAVDHSKLPQTLLSQMEHTIGCESEYWVLDLSHDFEIPVFVAVAQHRTNQKFTLGFGCHLDPELACKRALTELCQTHEIRKQHSAPFDFDAITSEPYLFPCESELRLLNAFSSPKNDDIRLDILYCIERANQVNIELLVLNFSRPDLSLRTAKIIAPGLCHIFPYFANDRLYHVPVSLNWRTQAMTEQKLNPLLLLI